MGIRTVRLDGEAEQILEDVMQATGLSISAVLKRGVLALKEEIARSVASSPYEMYKKLDLGPGGTSLAPSTEVRRGVREALRKKHGR